MKYQKVDKSNVFKNIFQNIADSSNGCKIMLKESTTVKRLIPIEIIAGLIIGLVSGFKPIEFIILLAVIIHLLTSETLNTAIEEVNDLVTEEENERVKRSKDIASAAVYFWHIAFTVLTLGFALLHVLGVSWWTMMV